MQAGFVALSFLSDEETAEPLMHCSAINIEPRPILRAVCILHQACMRSATSCCAGPERRPACALCPVSGGLMRQTTCGRWVHAACALWTPGTWINSETGLVEGLSKLPKVAIAVLPAGHIAVGTSRLHLSAACNQSRRVPCFQRAKHFNRGGHSTACQGVNLIKMTERWCWCRHASS